MTEDLLRAYDQTRGELPTGLPPEILVDTDGPVYRISGQPWGGFLGYRDLGGLAGAELDAFIARQRDFFAARGEKFEWKTYAHDEPADLPDRLVAAGFVADEVEAIVVGRVAPLAVAPVLPAGVRLREITSTEDLAKLGELQTKVWGEDLVWLADALGGELAVGVSQLTIVVAETDTEVVSAAWVRFGPGAFCSLWGGSTLAEWRGQGIYKALVAYRAQLAAARGYEYVNIDASPDSRPILERLGLTVVTMSTPYRWTP